MNYLISENNGLKEWQPDKDDNRKLSEIIDLCHKVHGKNIIEETMKYAHFRKHIYTMLLFYMQSVNKIPCSTNKR